MIQRWLIALYVIVVVLAGDPDTADLTDPHAACMTVSKEPLSKFVEWWNDCTALCQKEGAPYNVTRVIVTGKVCGPSQEYRCREALKDPVKDKAEMPGQQGQCMYEGPPRNKTWFQIHYNPVTTCYQATGADSFVGWVNECTVNCTLFPAIKRAVVQLDKPCGNKRNWLGRLRGRCRVRRGGQIGECSC